MDNILAFSPRQLDTVASLMDTYDLDLASAIAMYNTNARAKLQELDDLKMVDAKRMTKEEVITATWKMPEMDKYLYELLGEQGGFLTGSNVTSNIEHPNDEDWCVQIAPNAFSQYSIGQSDQGYWEADGFSTVYCHFRGKLINIICFSDTELFKAWHVATKIMQDIKHRLVPENKVNYGVIDEAPTMADLFADKWKRVILFRALKDIAYEPRYKRAMDKDDARKYHKCSECSREAIYFTCRAARKHYEATTVCERCAGITY